MNWRIYILLFLFVAPQVALGTHNRAGEITFRNIQGYEYEITITTYTYTKSQADRNELTVLWGDDDNFYSQAIRIDTTYLPNFYKKNIYIARHSYPGPGRYTILVQDPNRNFGVKNIPNSVNVIFSLTTTLIINANFKGNNTPVLLNPPTDQAALGHVFIHNPGAYDPDGDSLSYSLAINRGEGGQPIVGYTLPPSSNTPIYINPISGNLVWDSPTDTGAYNIAINITEWRDGVKIGSILRDMQIDVYNADNNPPVIQNQQDLCVIAGDTISARVFASDLDGDSVFMSAQGGPFDFEDSPAFYTHDTLDVDFSSTIINEDTIEKYSFTFDKSTLHVVWPTTCSHIRKQPYNMILRAEDDSDELSLSDIKNFFVRVIPPPPEKLEAGAFEEAIRLTWESGKCGGASYYKIYRFDGPSSFTPDSCETGIPESAELTFIGRSETNTPFSFVDDNAGQGLIPGIEYCYRIVAVYPDGAESIASDETCATLEPGSPPITNVSLFSNKQLETDSIFISWIKPKLPDTIAPPYRYSIFRSDYLKKENLDLLEDIPNANPEDTVYMDYSATDTSIVPFTYSVAFYGQHNGKEVLVGTPELAATLYLTATPGDNKVTLSFNKFSPWIDTAHVIYRKNNPEDDFDSIGTTYKKSFVDTGLKNHKTYWYKVKSLGWRKIKDHRYDNENFSHPIKAKPIDNEPPCAPTLTVSSDCDSLINTLNWNNPNLTCANDVIRYRVYYAFENSNALNLIDSITNQEITNYIHQPINGPIGFYAVSAVDSFYNESNLSNIVAVDTCKGYTLPNVFTPNDDGTNDMFISYNPNNYVKEIDIQIFNRWGQLMFETTDPTVNWDGKSAVSKQRVSDGVYFYICTVYEPGIFNSRIVYMPRQLSGFIHVFTNKTDQTPIEDF